MGPLHERRGPCTGGGGASRQGPSCTRGRVLHERRSLARRGVVSQAGGSVARRQGPTPGALAPGGVSRCLSRGRSPFLAQGGVSRTRGGGSCTRGGSLLHDEAEALGLLELGVHAGSPGLQLPQVDGGHLLLPPAVGAEGDAGQVWGRGRGGRGGVGGEGGQGPPPQGAVGGGGGRGVLQAAVGAADTGGASGGGGGRGGVGGRVGGRGAAQGDVLLLALEPGAPSRGQRLVINRPGWGPAGEGRPGGAPSGGRGHQAPRAASFSPRGRSRRSPPPAAASRHRRSNRRN